MVIIAKQQAPSKPLTCGDDNHPSWRAEKKIHSYTCAKSVYICADCHPLATHIPSFGHNTSHITTANKDFQYSPATTGVIPISEFFASLPLCVIASSSVNDDWRCVISSRVFMLKNQYDDLVWSPPDPLTSHLRQSQSGCNLFCFKPSNVGNWEWPSSMLQGNALKIPFSTKTLSSGFLLCLLMR